MYSTISFQGMPSNYKQIDNFVSRSAQPMADDIKWLKEQGVTDIINFRTMYIAGVNFNEKQVVQDAGITYHQLPSYTGTPEESKISKFLDIVEGVKESGGKVHIHCKAGADRTGMYSWIYKQKNNIGTMQDNESEMLKMGHHKDIYPDLIGWIKDFLNKK